MDFCNSSIPYGFEVEESISSSFPKLPCLGNLENPGQLRVLQVLEGTDDWILWIFVISSLPTFGFQGQGEVQDQGFEFYGQGALSNLF